MIRRTSLRTLAAAVMLLALAGLAAGCSTGPSASTSPAAPSAPAPAASSGPASDAVVAAPTIKVLTPADGTAIDGSEVAVRVETTGLKFVNPSNTIVAGEGHVHFTLDGQPFKMSVSPEYSFKDVAPGAHTLRAELVQNNTEPFAPAVYETVEFTVE